MAFSLTKKPKTWRAEFHNLMSSLQWKLIEVKQMWPRRRPRLTNSGDVFKPMPRHSPGMRWASSEETTCWPTKNIEETFARFPHRTSLLSERKREQNFSCSFNMRISFNVLNILDMIWSFESLNACASIIDIYNISEEIKLCFVLQP